MNGTVKFYNFKKNFGFITGEDGNDYFVHRSGISNDQMVKDGMPVTFDVETDDKGKKAVNVKKA
jgi:cold shock protein